MGEIKKMKILFVDSSTNQEKNFRAIFGQEETFARSIQPYAYAYFPAKDAASALRIYQEAHPDLIMINMDLGSEMSKRLCQTIRGLEGARHTGIILMALEGNEEDSTPIECLEIGADDVIRAGCPLREIRARTNAVLRLKAMTDELRSANHKLHKLSLTDELTGLDNMRAFNAKYSRAISDCRQGITGLGVIMIDLDNFKLVNDKSNHLMGSHVISEVGKLIRTSGVFDPKNDCTARYGGDEYIFFSRTNSVEEIQNKAEEIRKLIRAGIFVKDGFSIRITTSVGICWVPANFAFSKAEDPIKAADMMLYRSKKDGRDRLSTIALRDTADIDALNAKLTSEEDDPYNPKLSKVYKI